MTILKGSAIDTNGEEDEDETSEFFCYTRPQGLQYSVSLFTIALQWNSLWLLHEIG